MHPVRLNIVLTTGLLLLVVRTRKAAYHIRKLKPVDAADAALISRAIEQQAADDEDDLQKALENFDLDDMDDDASDRLDDAFFDDEGVNLKLPDETRIDPPR